MNKLMIFLMSFILMFTMSCDSDDTIVGGGIDIEPELVGCEATSFYDWSDFTFETSLIDFLNFKKSIRNFPINDSPEKNKIESVNDRMNKFDSFKENILFKYC